MIEPVQPDEAADVADFVERVIHEAVDGSRAERDAFVANVRANLAQWQVEPATALHLKHTESGILRGVVMLKNFRNLCHLFVDPDVHRRGIGSALLAGAVEAAHARGVEAIRLNAARNALGFYESRGFTHRTGVQVPGAWPMELRLDQRTAGWRNQT